MALLVPIMGRYGAKPPIADIPTAFWRFQSGHSAKPALMTQADILSKEHSVQNSWMEGSARCAYRVIPPSYRARSRTLASEAGLE